MSDKHLFLHIGTHKTGTTSIQNFLRANGAALASRGFYYPTEGAYYFPGESSQSLLAHALLRRRPHYIRDVELDIDSCVGDIRRDIGKSACPRVIVSSEHFSRVSAKEDVFRIREVFSGLAARITVIIYLRRQDALWESIWSQKTKMGTITSSFNEFLATEPDWDYFQCLELFASVFGQENLIVRPFERAQLFNNDLISDFLQVIDCRAHSVPEVRTNESPPVEMLELMRILGKSLATYRERNALNRLLVSLPIEIDQARYALFPEHLRSAFLDRHRDSNSRVAKEYLGRPDGRLFFDSETINLPVYPGMTLERFAQISGEVITLLAKMNSKLARKIQSAEVAG